MTSTLLPSGPRELEKGQVPMQVQSDPDSGWKRGHVGFVRVRAIVGKAWVGS